MFGHSDEKHSLHLKIILKFCINLAPVVWNTPKGALRLILHPSYILYDLLTEYRPTALKRHGKCSASTI